MIPILTLLIVISLSIIITRIATIALVHTGLARESARLQARSALSGTGFTTTESEKVVNHPVRRRIILTLMMVGSAGIVTVISSLMLTVLDLNRSDGPWLRVLFLAGGIGVLWLLASSKWIDYYLSNFIAWSLNRYTSLDVRDYARLMHLSGEYSIAEILVREEDWLAGKALGAARLRDEGIVVLGIVRENGAYIGAPNGDTAIVAGDTVIAYGRISALEALDQRTGERHGQREHLEAVAEQIEVEEEEEEQDPVAATT